MAMFDAFYRGWDGATGPDSTDPWYRITEDLIPAGVDSLNGGHFQSDQPIRILATGTGNDKRIHVILNHGPEYRNSSPGPVSTHVI